MRQTPGRKEGKDGSPTSAVVGATSSPRGASKDSKATKTSLTKPRSYFSSLLIISPCILLFFLGGIYVGANLIADKHEGNSNLASVGRTASVLDASDATKKIQRLRGPEAASLRKINSVEELPRQSQSSKEISRPISTSVDPDSKIAETKVHIQVPDRDRDKYKQDGKEEELLPPPSVVVVEAPEPEKTKASQSQEEEKTSEVLAQAALSSSSSSIGEPLSQAQSHNDEVLAGNMASRLRESFHAREGTAMITAPALDSPKVVVAAWVSLDKNNGGNDKDMRTIFSNKKAGCGQGLEQYGMSLYVNGWETSDHKLYLEYGSEESGCHKLDSGDYTFDTAARVGGMWTHVAAVMQNGYSALYVNGASVQRSAEAALPPHKVNNGPFTVGVYDTSYPFHGNISHFSVVALPTEQDEHQIGAIVQKLMGMASGGTSPEGLVASYPLKEASLGLESNGAVAVDAQNAHHGSYRFPKAHAQISFGLKVPLLDGLDQLTPPRGPNGEGVTAEMIKKSDAQGRSRRDAIRLAMQGVWKNYRQYAWGKDELKPRSHTGSDNWGGMGVTLVDSLDTLWVMGLKKEFDEARDWVAKSLTFAHAGTVSVFETTIRELGGLLSAYDLSGERVFLDKAKELGNKLAPAFGTPSGIAHGMVNMQSGQASGGWSGSSAILSEFGTLQIEFRNLAKYSQQPKFEEMSMKGMKFIHGKMPSNGLFPIKVDINTGRFTENTVTFGALGDSFYEYLLKVWLQGGRKENWLRDMYDRSMQGVMDQLLAISDPSGLVFVADWNGHSQHRKMDHLVCFLPGLLALGAHTDPQGKDSERARRDMAVAKSLMFTCREMYHRMSSGISPEYVEFPPGRDMVVGATAPFYILRPETAESLFVLGQLTKDPVYRDWAWEIWSKIDLHCKVPFGYGALKDVNNPGLGTDDRMESFFLGETMKYLYLAQDPDHEIDLEKYVLNTEAHPTKIFQDHKPVTL